MKLFLLLCLLALGNAKPYQPINVQEFLRNYDMMMADAGDDDNDIDDDDEESKEEEEEESEEEEEEVDNCPAGCQCWPKVVQCSDQGESTQHNHCLMSLREHRQYL